MSRDLKFLNAFNAIPGVGSAALRALKAYFGTYEYAWHADEEELLRSGITQQAAQAISWKRPSTVPDRELEKLIREHIWTVTEDDPHYPAALHEVPNAPVILYGRGTAWKSEGTNAPPCLAVVGTRKPTAYGLEVTEKIVRELAELPATIVSGLALGIDGRAHETTLSSGGTTIAVLGSGVDQYSIFPSEHRGLARRIAEENGMVISEYAPGTPAVREHFPARNRIIAGLAAGVLVVEAREKSGALITARLALDYNREVFAVPGPIFSATAEGPHRLIQQGAKLAASASDILEELGIEYTKNTKAADELLNESEQILLSLLEEPLGVDHLKTRCGLDTPAIIAGLSSLELRGRIVNLGGDTYQKSQ